MNIDEALYELRLLERRRAALGRASLPPVKHLSTFARLMRKLKDIRK